MRFYGWLLLFVWLTGFGCAAPKIDDVVLETHLQGAQRAITNAAELKAESLAAEEFGRAVKLLTLARNSQENGAIAQSAEFAYQAELVAQVASAKARQQLAKQQFVSVREQTYQEIIKEHEHELEIARTRHAITEAQLARALASVDEEQQQTNALATDITELTASLRQTELRGTISNAKLVVNMAMKIYPAIRSTADYERAQAAIALATSLVERKEFTEAENAALEAQKQVNHLYELATQKLKTEAEAKTKAQIAIAQTELIMQRAQYLNASQHAPQQLEEASAQLNRANKELAASRYEQAHRFAQQARQTAERAVATAEVIEYRQRAKRELDAQAAQAQQNVNAVKERLAEQAKTQVPQLESQLYKLANSAYETAKAALADKDYQGAIEAAGQSSDYLQRAVEKVQQLTSVKASLLRAARQIPKVSTVIERNDGVLIRISGNLFAFTSTELKKDFFSTFVQLAKILQQAAFINYAVRIEAHTGSMGPAGVNEHISKGRAQSIMEFLVLEGGVAEKRLTAVGLGETQPIVTDGENKQEQNRRIDIIISTHP